jgi:hypothetical protein
VQQTKNGKRHLLPFADHPKAFRLDKSWNLKHNKFHADLLLFISLIECSIPVWEKREHLPPVSHYGKYKVVKYSQQVSNW